MVGGLKGELKRKARLMTLVGGLIMVISLFVFAIRWGSTRPQEEQRKLIRAAALCADPSDLFNPASRMCKLENRVAFAAMAMQTWAQCNFDAAGAKILQSNMDESGSFWYSYEDRKAVAAFYSSCHSTCATSSDTYDRRLGVCVVQESEASQWLRGCLRLGSGCLIRQGRGVACDGSQSKIQARGHSWQKLFFTPGNVMTGAPSEASRLLAEQRQGSARAYYYPETGKHVEEFYRTCHFLCAKGDVVREAPLLMCEVRNQAALDQLSDVRRACTGDVPDWILASGSSWYYSFSHQRLVQVFYDSCVQ
mmetsp:Transcript_36381/g.113404  ORF Transcript_36381/g.113404 Transcript_36381/m.113404 type:complete len:307 (-) Transcript_36381:757-1677(-)